MERRVRLTPNEIAEACQAFLLSHMKVEIDVHRMAFAVHDGELRYLEFVELPDPPAESDHA